MGAEILWDQLTMRKRIKAIIEKITFPQVVIAGLVILIVLGIIYAIFDRPVQLPGTSLDDVPGITQQASYEVKSSTIEDNPDLIMVYVEDISTLSSDQLNALINAALRRAGGLSRDDVRISIKEYNDVIQEEDYPEDDGKNYVDPTSPGSYVSYGNEGAQNTTNYDTEPLIGYTFDQFVTELKPRTTYYEIYKTADNQYLVVLKGGYTRTEFETEVLSDFPEAVNANITYEDRLAGRQ